MIGVSVDYTEPGRLIGRYQELWEQKHGRLA